MSDLKASLAPLFCGIIFSIGLGVSGMTEPHKIISFLDIFGDWDPSLMLVMVGAISTHMILQIFIFKKPTPLFDSKFHLATNKSINKRLVFGAAVFGIGWGITGLCPGPGLASISTGNSYAIYFVAALIAGIIVAKKIVK